MLAEWSAGCDDVNGEGWAEEFRQLPNLEQVTRDGGKGLAKGVALVNAERQEQRPSRRWWIKGIIFTRCVVAAWACARPNGKRPKRWPRRRRRSKKLEECAGKDKRRRRPAAHARTAWREAEEAMDTGANGNGSGNKTKEALRLFTPDRRIEHASAAEAVLAQTLPQLPDSDFAKTKRQLQKPEMLNYLDHVQQTNRGLAISRGSEAGGGATGMLASSTGSVARAKGAQAAALRGVLLMCAVVLAKAGEEGQQAVAAVRDIFRRAYRASSLGGVHQQRAAHAPRPASQDDARPAGPQTPVLELPHLPHRPPPRHHPLPTSGRSLARGHALVGCAQINT